MPGCVSSSRPDGAVYVGPGTADWWFRRAAVETTIHRYDAEEALGLCSEPMPADRVVEGLEETFSFALPFAQQLLGDPRRELVVECADVGFSRIVGRSNEAATVTATGEAMLKALWGRNRDLVDVDGSLDVANEWFSKIERAFAGR